MDSEGFESTVAMYSVFRQAEGIQRIQSSFKESEESWQQKISIAAFVLTEKGPQLFINRGFMFRGPRIDADKLSLKLGVFYFSLFGLNSEQDLFQEILR